MIVVVFGLLIVILIFLLSKSSSQSKGKKTLEHIYRTFSYNSGLTNLQQAELWDKEFKGKEVIWEGIVDYVNESSVDNSYVLGVLHHSPEFHFPFDILISLPPKEKEKLLALKIGQQVRYSAELGHNYHIDYDYLLKKLRIHLDNGKIL